jgi:putative FmdB family regulatory protein
MPIYEFQCEKCEEVFALTMKMSDPHPESCPKCSQTPVRKLLSRTSFLLKGSGWYSDGYGSPPPPSEAKKGDKDTKAAPEASAATPTEGSAAAAKPSEAAKTATPASPSPGPASKGSSGQES